MKVMSFRVFLALIMMCALPALGHLPGEPQPMPTTLGQSLSGHDVVLPTATVGHPAVIVIGFSHGSSKAIERWDKEIGAQVTAKPGVPLYNIAVIQDAPRFVRGMIKGSMKALVPTAGQDRFLTVVQGEEELKRAVDFSSSDEAYVVVLDATGKIVFHTHGDPSEIAKKQVIEQIKD
jgi:hypothetical protein